jgi:hypothetical protein
MGILLYLNYNSELFLENNWTSYFHCEETTAHYLMYNLGQITWTYRHTQFMVLFKQDDSSTK